MQLQCVSQSKNRLNVDLGNVTRVNDISYGFTIEPSTLNDDVDVDSMSLPFQVSVHYNKSNWYMYARNKSPSLGVLFICFTKKWDLSALHGYCSYIEQNE